MSKKAWIWMIVALVLVLALVVTAVIWVGVLDGGKQPNVPDASQEQTPDDNGEGQNVDTPPVKDPTEQEPGQNPGQDATEHTEEGTEPTTQPTEEPTEEETVIDLPLGPNDLPWN